MPKAKKAIDKSTKIKIKTQALSYTCDQVKMN